MPRLVLLLALLVGCRPHVEYLYAHRITGVVLDADGAPVADATVRRVDAAGQFVGDEALYATKTGADGRFVFEFRGLGGEPAASDAWHLLASHPDHGEARADLVARWTDTGDCIGYCNGDTVLRLR